MNGGNSTSNVDQSEGTKDAINTTVRRNKYHCMNVDFFIVGMKHVSEQMMSESENEIML